MTSRPTACFVGARVEALWAVQRYFDVVSANVVPGSRAQQFCQQHGILMQLTSIRHREQSFDFIDRCDVDMVFSAGFPFILPEGVLHGGSLFVNAHPSLLPAYKGYNAVKDAVDAGEEHMGVTVHRMVVEVDAGPILAQERVWVQGMQLQEVYDLLFGVVEPMAVTHALENILPVL